MTPNLTIPPSPHELKCDNMFTLYTEPEQLGKELLYIQELIQQNKPK
jgi:hypothetical protein